MGLGWGIDLCIYWLTYIRAVDWRLIYYVRRWYDEVIRI